LIRIAARTRRVPSARHLTATQSLDARATAKAGLIAALFCAVGLLAGCGPSVKPDTPGGVNLAGSWNLNHQASADPDALITALVEKEMKHMRRRLRPEDEEAEDLPPPPAPGDAGRGPGSGRRSGTVVPPNGMFRPREGMEAYLRSQYTNALGSLLNHSDSLVVEQAPDRFTLARGDSRRTFTPGGHSVVGVAEGVADQNSGWSGREYVIDVRPQVGPRVTERYGLTPSGQLIEKISLSGDGLPKLEFTRVYEKGAAPKRVLPTSG
jgi:hypothetical protein